MMAGYRFVDSLLARHVDLLAMGNLKLLLEMNALVLFGSDEGARAGAAFQLAATEQRFYDQEGAEYAMSSSGMICIVRIRHGGVPPASTSLSSANLNCSSKATTAPAPW